VRHVFAASPGRKEPGLLDPLPGVTWRINGDFEESERCRLWQSLIWRDFSEFVTYDSGMFANLVDDFLLMAKEQRGFVLQSEGRQ